MFERMVTFFGEDLDNFGMPKPFHCYHVIVSLWSESPRRYFYAISLITEDSPLPELRRRIVDAENEDSVFNQVLGVLSALEGNQNLRHNSH